MKYLSFEYVLSVFITIKYIKTSKKYFEKVRLSNRADIWWVQLVRSHQALRLPCFEDAIF